MLLEALYPKLKKLANKISKEITIHKVYETDHTSWQQSTEIVYIYITSNDESPKSRIYIDKETIVVWCIESRTHPWDPQNDRHIDWCDPNLLDKIKQIMESWTKP